MSEIELTQCFSKHQRDFLVTVTVHKARNLNILNADTFVAVSFNDELKRTKTIASSDCPYYNEYFVFEVHTSLDNLLKKNIRLTVVQAPSFLRKSFVIGELNVNVFAIWRQEFHSFIKKWGVLEKIGADNKNKTTGYLQVDLSIVTTSEPPTPAILRTYDDDIIEENLLLPDASPNDPENVRYLVNIFDGNFTIKRDYIIQVSFGSFRTRTRQMKYAKYCKWNEQLIFHAKFQSLNQMMIFEVLVHDMYQWSVKCSFELNFKDICWNVDGTYNKPAFGPSHIIFYEGANRNVYCGKLLISIETEDVDEKIASPLKYKQDIIMPINENDYWNEEVFKVNMIAISADALNIPYGNMKLELTCDGVSSNSIDLDLKEYGGNVKFKYIAFSSNNRPLLSLSIKLPDNRLKNQGNNLIKMLIREMESNIMSFKLFEARYHDNVEYQVKCLSMLFDDLRDMLEGLKTKIYYKTFKKLTEFDENYLKFLQFTLFKLTEKSVDEVARGALHKKNVNAAFQEYLNIRDSLSMALSEIHGPETDVFLNIQKENKLLAFHRFSMADYIYSQSFDSKGQFCGKMQSIVVKPATCLHSCDNCGCMFGKFEIIMWIGSEKEVNEWLPQSALELASNKINFTVEHYYKCNVYAYQGKIQPGIDKSGLCDPKLMIVLNGQHDSTKVINQSLSVVWNEMLTLENVKIFDVGDDKHFDYPTITLLLYDEDKRKLELIGVALMKLKIKRNNNNEAKQQEDNKLILPFAHDKVDIRKIFHAFIHQFPPHLRWVRFMRNGSLAAEVLLSAELIQQSVPTISVMKKEKNEQLPPELSPDVRKFRIDVVFCGIRGALKISNFASGRHKMQLSIGELELTSNFSKKSYRKNLNFLDPYVSGYLLLPDQFQYWPPIIIKHVDCTKKSSNCLGAAMLRRSEKFYVEDKPKEIQRFLLNTAVENEKEEVLEIGDKEPLINEKKSNLIGSFQRYKIPKFLQLMKHSNRAQTVLLESEYTWWTKFYNSNREQDYRNENLYSLQIYPNELERQEEFEKLQDWAYPVDLYRGKSQEVDGKNVNGERYATLKCSIKITKCSGKEFFETGRLDVTGHNFRFKRIPNLLCEIPVVIRIYIVQAVNLRAHDISGDSDAFIKIKFGNQVISDHAHHLPNQWSPVFGKRYQVSGTIPKETRLKIAIYDHDTLSKNDLIGKTHIDVEDRVRTKYQATCGLPTEYNSSGYNCWRNSLLPSEILRNLCNECELSLPQYYPSHVTLAGMEFKDTSKITKDPNIKERLALSVLNNFNKIPGVGYKLIPEHVETRSLFRKDRPGIEQGKLLMWIEIFDPRRTVPESVDITPSPPRKYELRVIIWNTKDVILSEKNIFGTSMNDIYVKGWLESIDDPQYTDIHFRSITGEGNFNWRMIFPFNYSVGEDMMILRKRKNLFEKFDTEIKLPPILNIQVWDNDSFSPDDFLGTLTVNLSHFPRPAVSHEKCAIRKVTEYENLFAISESVKGWFPVVGTFNDAIKQTGKIEIELQVLSEEKAKAIPAGLGRDGPNQLSPPNRPPTSFNWYRNPMQSVKHILYPQMKKCFVAILIFLVILALILIVVLSLAKLPQGLLFRSIRNKFED